MNLSARWRAWRFVHPDFPASAASGLRLSPTGGVAMVTDGDSVRQSLHILLTTLPGERVMRPEYGCELRRLVFMPNDDTTAGLAMHYVRQAVERWEARAEILRLDAGPHPERPEVLEIRLLYRLRGSPHGGEEIVVPVDLNGGAA